MTHRALSVITTTAALTAALLSPVALGSAAADTTSPVVAPQSTYKSGVSQRTRRAAAKAAIAAAAAAAAAPAPVASYTDRVLAATNAERTSRGLKPLAASTCAAGFAQSWSGQLASAGSLSHQRLLPIVESCGGRTAGENVAYGNVSPEQLVAMWMGSAGHRANILNPDYSQLGVGQTTTSTGRVYGVQVFTG